MLFPDVCYHMLSRQTTPYLFPITHTSKAWKTSDLIQNRTEYMMRPSSDTMKYEEIELKTANRAALHLRFVWFDVSCL